MKISHIELTETGIVLQASDGSRVELCGKDVWDLLMWMNWHVLELGQLRSMEGLQSAVHPQEVRSQEDDQ